MAGFEATAQTDVAAPPERVWAALTDPAQIATYMQGSKVTTTWQVGSPITWDGEYDGRSYQDKGEVLTYDEPRVLSVTHYSPMMGQPDEPENYHTLVYTLTPDGEHPPRAHPGRQREPGAGRPVQPELAGACSTGSRPRSRTAAEERRRSRASHCGGAANDG